MFYNNKKLLGLMLFIFATPSVELLAVAPEVQVVLATLETALYQRQYNGLSPIPDVYRNALLARIRAGLFIAYDEMAGFLDYLASNILQKPRGRQVSHFLEDNLGCYFEFDATSISGMTIAKKRGL